MADFVKDSSLGQREGRFQKMSIKQPDDIGIEAVEFPDLVDPFLVVFHFSMIVKLLDFVK